MEFLSCRSDKHWWHMMAETSDSFWTKQWIKNFVEITLFCVANVTQLLARIVLQEWIPRKSCQLQNPSLHIGQRYVSCWKFLWGVDLSKKNRLAVCSNENVFKPYLCLQCAQLKPFSNLLYRAGRADLQVPGRLRPLDPGQSPSYRGTSLTRNRPS